MTIFETFKEIKLARKPVKYHDKVNQLLNYIVFWQNT